MGAPLGPTSLPAAPELLQTATVKDGLLERHEACTHAPRVMSFAAPAPLPAALELLQQGAGAPTEGSRRIIIKVQFGSEVRRVTVCLPGCHDSEMDYQAI